MSVYSQGDVPVNDVQYFTHLFVHCMSFQFYEILIHNFFIGLWSTNGR